MGNDEHGLMAMPRLYGAPAYSRPQSVSVKPSERPFDPDDLPLVRDQPGAESVPGDVPDGRPSEDVASAVEVPATGEDAAAPRGRPFWLGQATVIPGGGDGSEAGEAGA
jgi:hypothetical protein